MLPTIKHATLKASAIVFCLAMSAPTTFAGLFGDTPDLGGPSGGIEDTVIDVIKAILSFMALVAVVIIVIAGIRLVVSQGEQEAVEKSKKTILYAVIGLIIILLAQAIVDFIADFAT
ncbi:pilin [Patescibacteria group bacterium]|nr:pilin [Patescibacteria group bacterium]MBU2259089.1 pilin [Patescibacteria group bacterium]